MPSNTSANCCMGRNPPSPEGPAPRLAISPPTPNRNLSASRDPRAPIPSWGTSLSAQCGVELRAIFEDDKSEDESPELKAKVTPRLKALLGGDKPYSADDPKAKVRKSRTAKLRALLEGDPEHQRVKPKESSSTLSVVKNKLKKALPGGLVISKRHSRSSVGTSEEIERRAELRRIRQKRIQDELSNEGIYDEDAKSLSTVEGADSSLGNKNRNPWVSGDFLPLPELTPLALPLPSFPFPKLPLPHE
jgi:hypothetical protein